jgi:peptidoglycan/LPS O-acetylase OafA/YrhL
MNKGKNFEVLNSWRGICAMMIVLYHVPWEFFFSDLAVIRYSWLFVDFFFVLSGFVTTHGYGTEIANLDSAFRFIKRRFYRLYPLHFCTLGAALGFILLLDTARMIGAMKFPELIRATDLFAFSFKQIGSHLLLLQGFWGIGFNVPSWAVSVEFWTYIVFAICCLLLGPHLLLSQLFLTFACLVLLYALSNEEWVWYANMVRCLAGFSLGSATYLLLSRFKSYQVSTMFMTALEGIVFAEMMVFLWCASRLGGMSAISETDTIHQLQWLSPIVFAQAIAIFSFEGGTISRLLNRPILNRAGAYSYSTYMLQALILNTVFVLLIGLMRLGVLNVFITKTAGTAILLLVIGGFSYVSRLSYDKIERPGQSVLPEFVARSSQSLWRGWRGRT